METDTDITRQNMIAAGVDPDEPAYEDYFGFNETQRWDFPDHLQWIEFRQMTEGDRRKYQSKTTKDIKLEKNTGDARVRVDPGVEREILFECSVMSWHIVRKQTDGSFKPIPVDKNASLGSEFGKWSLQADPKLLDGLERAIRKANPWMQSEMTAEALREEIKNLEELLDAAVKREAGKDDSA